ncbi:LOW QUALITY PROTEIN: uncharacterized protein LOC116719764 [Xiphophorus hellerii]|uniref:LOW QUALITY PROTEIN: uncharacterized protein LOC116719764 n=1 Tax=Xiphophorus hellerii TaxID=8084 RepID=UPI0013B427CA|nr:LOW QUALITY PROTEIN: uncharacterized protein LOC116719764 [Xiphophorus hellerii]
MVMSLFFNNLDSVEGSIQHLLSALYPPYEATAPTLLSQLFQIIDGRYQRDALRCFLDFLVPAKHILDTVQQAACAQYSNVLFLCEGWPLCLRDQVVVHLAPIDPLLLQPGDFYLQVTPFCDQSARIVVCSLLKEEGLAVEVVEETPVPETSYPCIFSSGWLDEINQDRQGSPLRQCLVATERGVVRLPWERVAVPDFVQLARCAGSSMASAAPSNSPLTPPPPPPLPDSSKTSSSDNAFFPLSSSKKSEQLNPVTASQNSGLTSSPAAFSVETRICPAKHGIAVSLCLVDARTSSLSHLVKIKGSEAEHKPIGWVSPHTWDSRFTGTNQNATTKTEKPSLSGGNIIDFKVGNKGAVASENILEDKQRDSKAQRMSRHEPAAVATGDYIDILQAKMLFDKDWSLTEEQKHPNWQNQPITQPFSTQSEVNSQTKAQDSIWRRRTSICSCIRTVRFAEKPCTPCLARRQGGKVTKAQELRCRYRDSYQAAIQNPVTFGAENNRGNMPAVVEEDTDTSQIADKLRAKDSWRDVQDTRCHPGSCCRDRTGRAIVELYGHDQGWGSTVTSHELFQMLLYFYSITRKEIREAGMTLIFDARKKSPQPQFYKALMTLHEWSPHAVNSLVLLVDKENNPQPERCPGIQTDLVTSMKALLKLVEVNQLSFGLDGTAHGYCDWLELHQAVQQCMMDQRTLMRTVLEDSRLVGLQREGGAILARLRKESDLKYPHCEDLSDAVDSVTSLYNYVEEQAHILVQRTNVSLEHLEYLLQLREMEGHFMQIQQWFAVEGERHLMEAESVEGSGERMEQILNSFTGFLIEASDRRHHAMSLVSEAERLQQSGLPYPETGGLSRPSSALSSRTWRTSSAGQEACGRELQIMVNICDFCEQAVELANECTDYLNLTEARNLTVQSPESASWISQTNTQLVQKQSKDPVLNATSLCQSDVQASPDRLILQSFQEKFLHFSPEKLHEVKVHAGSLRGSRGMHVWNAAWLRFHEAQQQLQERMQELEELRHQPADPSSSCEGHFVDVVSTNIQTASPGGTEVGGAVDPGASAFSVGGHLVRCRGFGPAVTLPSYRRAAVMPGQTRSQSSHLTGQPGERRGKARKRHTSRARSERDAAALSQSHPVGCQWFPWRRGLGARSVSQDSCAARASAAGSTPEEQGPRSPPCCSHRGQPSCRILQEAQKFQISRHGSFCSDNSCMSDGGAAGAECCKHSSLPPETYGRAFCLSGPQENVSSALRVQHVMEELVFTEREYVRSLGYILTHYLPLMDRLDIPQDLRGKRGIIFGNLEKVYDFHSHYFLPELEACERQPAMVARCFLRHSESFGLYALYSKNKPQSDALILHRRHDIFKKKQQELGDLMDLSSYLLRPIQRISKYSLLLQDMLALVGPCRSKQKDAAVCAPDSTCIERDRERSEIQAAAHLIQFQMRHGNDLLTMDAIQDCDVNLKEQGELIRQDEFTVFFRKKKCVRRVFLFEHLILFSKTKRTDIGNDVYVCKQSFKTNDIGMTHNSGVSGLCFEIWFRRRKSEDTYTLKASSTEVKEAWTTDLERILWNQAAHSRELRLQERVFMGTGRSPFMDIQPSDAAICDRAVSCVLPGRSKKFAPFKVCYILNCPNPPHITSESLTRAVPVACCSHRGLDYPRPHSIGSGSTASTTVSQSSSSSGRGSLPPSGYLGNTNPGVGSSPEAVTENELNSHHLLQHQPHPHCDQWKTHCPLIDSTDSSGESMNLYSSPDHSCLSAISGEVVDDSSVRVPEVRAESNSLSDPQPEEKQLPLQLPRKKPGIPPKPPHLANPQGKLGRSTEV